MTLKRRERPADHRALSGGGGSQHSGPHGTETAGAALLVAALDAHGCRPEQKGHAHWTALCPCHDDDDPSLIVDVKASRYPPHQMTLLVYCQPCGSTADLMAVCTAVGVETWRVLTGNEVFRERPPERIGPLPSPSDVIGWRRALWGNCDALGYLLNDRGLDDRVLQANEVGWDKNRRCYTLPVYRDGDVVNLRRYYRHQTRKMRGLAGRGIDLYPNVPEDSWVLLVEGEWDALLGRQYGLPTLTTTGGAQGWKAGWDDYVVNKDVVILFDCDKAGREGAQHRARRLRQYARTIKVVDLAPRLRNGYDLTDHLRRYRTADRLLQLIALTKPLGRKEG